MASPVLNLQQSIAPAVPRQHAFLHTLASKSENARRYKRYGGLPLRYAGGKSLAVGFVIEQMPKDVRRMMSPFVGGASVEIACANELDAQVFAYDVFDVLTNYWQVQLAQPEKLAATIEKWQPTKAQFTALKARLKQHWTGENKIADKLELAAYYWFTHNLSYGPGFLGWMSAIYEEEDRFHRLLDKVRNFSCPNLQVNPGRFEETIPQHPHDFLYCDPPYYLDGDSKMFRGIYPQRNFPVHHNGFDHAKLAELLLQHKGGFILSYNDCEAVRAWYKKFKIVEVEWQYTLGQGETRIGKNRIENGTPHNIKQSHELLIVGV